MEQLVGYTNIVVDDGVKDKKTDMNGKEKESEKGSPKNEEHEDVQKEEEVEPKDGRVAGP